MEKASPEEAFTYFREVDGGLTPESKNLLVKKVRPTIDYTLASMDAKEDPVMNAEAKVAAANALDTYDPEKGIQLNTYVASQLKKLNRTKKKRDNSINIPERKQNMLYQVQESERQFTDSYGREPSMAELADASALPIKKIQELKSTPKPGYESNAPEGITENASPDYFSEALDYVYTDAPYKDKKLLEYSFGYGGVQTLPSNEIAKKLNISQSQISRRLAKLRGDIVEIENALNYNI